MWAERQKEGYYRWSQCDWIIMGKEENVIGENWRYKVGWDHRELCKLLKGFEYSACDAVSLEGYKQGSEWLDLKFKKNTVMPCVEGTVWGEVRKFLQWFKLSDGSLGVEGDGRKGRHIWRCSWFNIWWRVEKSRITQIFGLITGWVAVPTSL